MYRATYSGSTRRCQEPSKAEGISFFKEKERGTVTLGNG